MKLLFLGLVKMITITSSKLFQKNALFDTFLKITTIGSILLFLVVSLTEYITPIWMIIFIPAVFMHIVQEYKNSKNLKKVKEEGVFSNDDIFLSTATYPQPGTTLMHMLKAEGVVCQDVKAMQLMTCSLEHGCEYYQDKLINDGYKIDLIDKIDIYGMGDIKESVKICQSDKVKLHSTKTKLTKHINIITTRDERCFVCYEPHHIIDKNGKDILKYGSFLVEIQQHNIDNIISKFKQEIKRAA